MVWYWKPSYLDLSRYWKPMKSVFQRADDVTRTMSAHSMKYLQDTQPHKNNRMDQWHKGALQPRFNGFYAGQLGSLLCRFSIMSILYTGDHKPTKRSHWSAGSPDRGRQQLIPRNPITELGQTLPASSSPFINCLHHTQICCKPTASPFFRHAYSIKLAQGRAQCRHISETLNSRRHFSFIYTSRQGFILKDILFHIVVDKVYKTVQRGLTVKNNLHRNSTIIPYVLVVVSRWCSVGSLSRSYIVIILIYLRS